MWTAALGASLLVLLGSSAASAQAPGGPPPSRPLLWSIADADSRVYLLGSVHALPVGTDVLPGPAGAAYADAEVLAFEVDLDLAPAAAAEAIGLAMATDGVPLSKRLGVRDAARLRQALGDAGLDASAVENVQPWFVSLLLGSLPGRSGFSPAAGVDVQLFGRAGTDGKARLGLETVADQIGALAGLPMKDQLALLHDALADNGGGLSTLVDAWQAGNADALAALIAAGLGSTPGLRRRVLTDRNERWVPQIEAFLDRTDDQGRPEDVLVVVGAGHLVGPESVVELLQARGLKVTRVDG